MAAIPHSIHNKYVEKSMHSPRLPELPHRHHPQQQIQMLVDVMEECLIAVISIQSFMVWPMPMDEVDGRLATAN